MKYQVLFSLKAMKKYSRLSSAAVVIGIIRVKIVLVIEKPEMSTYKYQIIY